MGQKLVNGQWEVWDDHDVEERDEYDFEKVYNQKIKIYSDVSVTLDIYSHPDVTLQCVCHEAIKKAGL